jgi:hypothetical protein
MGKAFCANCGRAFSVEQTAAATPSTSTLGRVTGPDLAVLGGAALLVAAPFFPFITATAALVGSISRNGVELTSGEALVLSGVGVVAALLALRKLGQPKGLLPVLLGLLGLGLTVYYYLQVDERVQGVDTEIGFASVGAGLWMAFAGAGLIVLGALIANRRKAKGAKVGAAEERA